MEKSKRCQAHHILVLHDVPVTCDEIRDDSSDKICDENSDEACDKTIDEILALLS